jgi:hypothetical protein
VGHSGRIYVRTPAGSAKSRSVLRIVRR